VAQQSRFSTSHNIVFATHCAASVNAARLIALSRRCGRVNAHSGLSRGPPETAGISLCDFRTFAADAVKDASWPQGRHLVQSRRTRPIPSFAFQASNQRHHRRDIKFIFHATHAPMKTVYTRSAHQSRKLRFGWIAPANALSPEVPGRS